MKHLALLGSIVVLAACGRSVSESDCAHIRDNMREAWSAEAKNAAPPDGGGAEKATAIIKAEGEKLAGEWMTECQKDLMGRRVEPAEMDCLLRARTIIDINKCSE